MPQLTYVLSTLDLDRFKSAAKNHSVRVKKVQNRKGTRYDWVTYQASAPDLFSNIGFQREMVHLGVKI